MRCIAVDLEMNQPSRKIIQIGAVCFEPDTGKIVSNFHMFVNPGEPINPEIIELTRITDEMVNFSPNIQVAAQRFTDFKKSLQANPIGIVWGAGTSNDVRKIYEESGLDNPFHVRIIDVKAVFQMLANTSSAEMRQKCGLKRACEILKIGWALDHGEQHNALADAFNTYRLYMFLSKCLKGGVNIKMG